MGSSSTRGEPGQAPRGSRVAFPCAPAAPTCRAHVSGTGGGPGFSCGSCGRQVRSPAGSARRGAQHCLRCPPRLGPLTLGLAPLRAWRISPARLPVPAAAAGPPEMPRCFVREPQRLFVCRSPTPASPGLRAELELPGRRETSPVRGRSWAEAPHGALSGTGTWWRISPSGAAALGAGPRSLRRG